MKTATPSNGCFDAACLIVNLERTMPVASPVPKDHPLMIAWEHHKSTEEFANSRKWAKHDGSLDGSLWALFMAGWNASHHVMLGGGRYVIDSGTYRSEQAVFLEPVSVAGKVGVRTPDGVVSDNEVNPGTVIITFGNDASARVLSDEIALVIHRLIGSRNVLPVGAQVGDAA